MHKRTAHRWRLLAVIGTASLFALGSFWLLQIMHNGEAEVRADARRNEPDYIVDKFSFVHMTPDGKPHYIISGAKLTHRPLDDSSDIELPFVESVAPGQTPMTLRAQRARLDHGNAVVQLQGEVDIEQAGGAGAEAMSLKTQALTLLPDEDRMETRERVDMMLGSSAIRGTGMHADNAKRTLNFSSEGTIVYPPKPAQTAH
ncbi:MAG: LPS export ABC transporter periplasmic protein LptC [Pseudomonadota bacterium]